MSEIELSRPQMNFVNSDALYTLFSGGLGSGKTYAGAVWAVMMAMKYPHTKGLITANSYSQLKKATLSKFFDILNLLRIKYFYKQQDGVIELEGGAIVYAISMEKYDLLRGIEVGWAWSDECAFYKQEAYNVLIGRIRDKRGPCQWKGTTTPNGFNWLYTAFVENPTKSSVVIKSRTTDNMEHLPESYVEQLRLQYDTRLAQQELDGEFVNLNSGKVYYAFDRNKHVGKSSGLGDVIYCGLDFNVHPLCGVFAVFGNNGIEIIDELYLEDSNTFQAAKEIIKRYPFQNVRVVSDDSGSKRKTSSNTTDHEILRRANLNVVPFRNPGIKDRYNNLNRLFDHKMIKISPNCKHLIEDLEKLVYDNKDEMLSHISDALGYLAWHLLPFKKPSRAAVVRYQ